MKPIETRKQGSLPARILDHAEMLICLTGMSGMLIIVMLQVIFRFVLGTPIGWAEEVSKMFTVLVTFGGSSYAFHMGAHVGVSVLVDHLPARCEVYAKLLGYLITAAFFCCMLYFGFHLAAGQFGKISIAARIPMVIPYAFLPVGAAMVLIRVVTECVEVCVRPLRNRGGEDA